MTATAFKRASMIIEEIKKLEHLIGIREGSDFLYMSIESSKSDPAIVKAVSDKIESLKKEFNEL